jgi:hypothetical protein
MKLFGVILLAGLISFIVGFGVTIAGSALLPCYSDKAGCGMGDAYRIFFVPVYVLAGMIGFGISAPGKARERPLKLTMMTLILASVFLGLFAVASDVSKGRSTSIAGLLEMIQLMSAFWVVIVVQWWVIRRYLRRRGTAVQAVA